MTLRWKETEWYQLMPAPIRRKKMWWNMKWEKRNQRKMNPQKGHYEVQREHPSPSLHENFPVYVFSGWQTLVWTHLGPLGFIFPPWYYKNILAFLGARQPNAKDLLSGSVWLMNTDATQSSHSSIGSSNLLISSECLYYCQLLIKLNGTVRKRNRYGNKFG